MVQCAGCARVSHYRADYQFSLSLSPSRNMPKSARNILFVAIICSTLFTSYFSAHVIDHGKGKGASNVSAISASKQAARRLPGDTPVVALENNPIDYNTLAQPIPRQLTPGQSTSSQSTSSQSTPSESSRQSPTTSNPNLSTDSSSSNPIGTIYSTISTLPTIPTREFYPAYIHTIGKTLKITNLKELNNSYNHMEKFGYFAHAKKNLDENQKQNVAKASQEEPIVLTFRGALQSYQTFMGLPLSGQLDRVTTEHMKKFRCGNRDLGAEYPHQKASSGNKTALQRAKRYFLAGSRWRRDRDIRYCISKFPSAAKATNVIPMLHYEIWRAFKMWSKHLPFTIRPMPCVNSSGVKIEKAQIDIRFEVGEHGDGDPFDGIGGVLAHALFPEFGGDLHFDESEWWTNTANGTNLFAVSLHEIGHVLGLEHSSVPGSIMAPIYKYQRHMQLSKDDLIGLRAIYEQ